MYAFTVSCVAEVEGALRHVRKLRDDFTTYRYHFRGRCYRQYGHLAFDSCVLVSQRDSAKYPCIFKFCGAAKVST